MDKNKHKLYMAQILSLIFKDKDICNFFPLFRLQSYNFLPIKAFSIGRGNLSIIMMV